MDVKNSAARVQLFSRPVHRKSLPDLGGSSLVHRNRSSASGSPSCPQRRPSSSSNPSSEPFVSTNTWSRYGAPQTSADYARFDKHAGNIFRNFYAVGYQRHRRLISTHHHRGSKFGKKPSTRSPATTREPSSVVIAVFHLIMKLRERVVICFGITFVLFTLILVIDFQYEIGYGGHRFFMPMRHGRVQMVEDTGPGGAAERSVYKSFQNKYGPAGAPVQGSEGYEDSVVETGSQTANLTEPHDRFDDLAVYTRSYDDLDTEDAGRKVVIVVFEYRQEQPSLSEYINFDQGVNETLQITFHKRISKREMYKENDALVVAILQELQSRKIVHVREKEGGTQLKLIIHYDNGEFALFKPMRFPREQQTLPNHFYFTDYERHNAEIAAFHLDRLLGFRRSMPVTGRLLNLTSEFYKVADAELLKTFFVSPANNLCFHGHCSYYCDTSHAICGNPDRVEGSFAAFLPEKQVADRTLRKHPWRRSYHKRRKALWETEPNYCDAVKRTPPYNRGILLLDLVDTSMFDFLMGNMDRHHFETFAAFGNDTFPLHLDHGRGFGRPFHDELSILAPLTQCCIVKQNTLKMLLGFHNGEKRLSHYMRESLQGDPLNPILWEPHFAALDRRVKIILEAIRECIRQAKESGSEAVSGSADATPPQ